MLVDVARDSYVITQVQEDGHTYCVGNGRVFSNLAEATQVLTAMLAKFEAAVPAGTEGTWHKPTLRAVCFK